MEDIGKTFLAVAERARMGLAIMDLADGHAETLYLSETAVEMFGRSREELQHLNLLETVHVDDRARVANLVRRITAGEVVEPILETVIQRGDGGLLPVRAAFVGIVHEGRSLTVNIVTDISEQRAAEKSLAVERKRVEEQLARADRLSALGTLAAGVAHEINNPLAFMSLNADLLVQLVETEMPDETARGAALSVARELQTGVNRVANIVRDLSTFSRDAHAGGVSADVGVVVASAERLVNHEVRHRARILIDLPPLPEVKASGSRLEQVFVNILLNAAQAFESVSEKNLIRVSGGVLDNQSVYVDVADNGPGIAPELVGRVFDPFFTTKPAGVGTGLGLSICQGIVARLGGEMSLKSRVGVGSVFRVALPPAHAAGSSALHKQRQAPLPSMRILVVDDEPAIGRAIRWLLEDLHEVEVVMSGQAALDRLLGDGVYDVILCDLMMSGLSGVDVYERVARAKAGLERRIVFMTGGAVNERNSAFLADVPNTRLDKPFDAFALESALRSMSSPRPAKPRTFDSEGKITG